MAADIAIECSTCCEQFVWTQDEQKFFRTRGLMNAPKHCSTCRKVRRAQSTAREQAKAAVPSAWFDMEYRQ
jgi:hypothetical protein